MHSARAGNEPQHKSPGHGSCLAIGMEWANDRPINTPAMCEQNLFAEWCNNTLVPVGSHELRILSERDGSRARVLPRLSQAVAAHYEAPERLAARMARVGFDKAAQLLRSLLPQTPVGRSGDLGEILATEAVPELLHPFHIPIKRLRWKDAREQAMRGEDLIGIAREGASVRFLKGEAKSRLALAPNVVAEARNALNQNNGRPSVHAMAFVMNRLFETGQDELALLFETYLLERNIAPAQLVHLCFVLSGNDPSAALTTDLQGCDGTVRQQAIGLRIADHQEFIASVFEQVSLYAGNR